MKIRIEVKQRHLRLGQRGNNARCAVALALMEKIPGTEFRVGYMTIKADDEIYALPARVTDHIRMWDASYTPWSLPPYSFILDLIMDRIR